ncbi:hypothetical protein P0D72_00625 [Paraburkholderia sediminicola]
MKLTLDHNVIIDLAIGSINIARLREILAKSGQLNLSEVAARSQ